MDSVTQGHGLGWTLQKWSEAPVEMVQPPGRGLRDAPVAERRGRVVTSAVLAGVVFLVEHLLWPSSNGGGPPLFHAARLARRRHSELTFDF